MRIAVLTHVAGRLTIRSKQMILVQLIMAVAIIAAVIVYFLRRSRKLKEMELEERMKDVYR